MAETPIDEVADWVRAGASSIIVHVEAGGDIVESVVEEWGHTAEIGLAINLRTPLETLMSFFEKVKTIQLMGIDHVGYQGQVLDDIIYNRIKNLRQLVPNHIIAVDGGVSLQNVKKLIDAGANKLVVGSAIFGEGVPSENFKNFQALNDR
jgi:ribulose-phosphate 3-epimerase